jgi:hypothetical protein
VQIWDKKGFPLRSFMASPSVCLYSFCSLGTARQRSRVLSADGFGSNVTFVPFRELFILIQRRN